MPDNQQNCSFPTGPALSEGLQRAALEVASAVIGFQTAPLEDAVSTDDAIAFVLGELGHVSALIKGLRTLFVGLAPSTLTSTLIEGPGNSLPKAGDFAADQIEQLRQLVDRDLPAVGACLASMLPLPTAVRVLAALPVGFQARIIANVCTTKWAATPQFPGTESIVCPETPGIERASLLLRSLTQGRSRRLRDVIEVVAPEAADLIWNSSVPFEQITQLDDRSIQKVLAAVDERDLVAALRGASHDLGERLLRNLSSRVAEDLRLVLREPLQGGNHEIQRGMGRIAQVMTKFIDTEEIPLIV